MRNWNYITFADGKDFKSYKIPKDTFKYKCKFNPLKSLDKKLIFGGILHQLKCKYN